MLYNLFENRDFVSVFAVALLAEGVDRNNPNEFAEERYIVALLAEGVDRNSTKDYKTARGEKSPSSRRAWIEIRRWPAPDRAALVALLAEGVDRNIDNWHIDCIGEVALLAEGVDRNCWHVLCLCPRPWSPSSRRAWIEITWIGPCIGTPSSPSSRRAWIEIFPGHQTRRLPSRRPPRGGRG